MPRRSAWVAVAAMVLGLYCFEVFAAASFDISTWAPELRLIAAFAIFAALVIGAIT